MTLNLYNEAIKYYNLGYSVITIKLQENPTTGKKQLAMPPGWQKFTYEDCKKHITQDTNAVILLTGLRTSKKNPNIKSVIVIDIDKGDESNEFGIVKHCGTKWVTETVISIDTVTEITGNKGRHFIFNYTPEIPKSSTGMRINDKYYKVDVRSDGGCAIIAPSFYKSKNGYKKYEWMGKKNSIINMQPKNLTEKDIELIKSGLKKSATNAPKPRQETIITQPNNNTNTPVNPVELEEVKELLNMMSIQRATEYDSWILVGMALKKYGEDGRKLFHMFSKKCEGKYNKKVVNEKFDSFGYSVPDLNTLRIWAKKDNYKEYMAYRKKNYEITFDDEINIDEWWLMKQLFCETITTNHTKKVIYTEIFHKYACKYLNHYICTLTRNSRSEYCLLDYKNGKIERITCKTKEGMMDFLTQYDNYFSKWASNRRRKNYDMIKFEPYSPIDSAIKNPKNLNLFMGFKQLYNDKLIVDMDIIQPILNHIKVILCDNDEESYNYFLHYLAGILQKPYKKRKIAMVISGKMGTGKTSFFEFFGHNIIGKDMYSCLNDMKTVTGQFNSLITDKLLTVLDECNTFIGDHQLFNHMKTQITQELSRSEKKFKDAGFVNDYNNYILISNDFHICKIEPNDRRYFCLKVNNKYASRGNTKKERIKYFERLDNAYNNESVQSHFFHYLLQRDISNVRFENIPLTEYKKQLIKLSASSEIQFVYELYKMDELAKEEYVFITTTDLYKKYTDFCTTNGLNKKPLSPFFQNLLSGEVQFLIKARATKRKTYGYKFNIDTRENMKKYLLEHEYPIEDEIEVEDIEEYNENYQYM